MAGVLEVAKNLLKNRDSIEPAFPLSRDLTALAASNRVSERTIYSYTLIYAMTKAKQWATWSRHSGTRDPAFFASQGSIPWIAANALAMPADACGSKCREDLRAQLTDLFVLRRRSTALAEGAQHGSVARPQDDAAPYRRVERIAEPRDLAPVVPQRHVE